MKKRKWSFALIDCGYVSRGMDCSKVIGVAAKLTDEFNIYKIHWKWKAPMPSLLKTQKFSM